MRRSAMLRLVTVVFAGALVAFQGVSVSTQQSLPWTGTAADEARSYDTGAVGAASVRARGLSGDGRFVTFSANYPLLSNDTNGVSDIYVRDRMTGAVERISVASDGTEANAQSDPSAISEDGRHVAFMSSASNLVAGDTNGWQDVFVHDRETHTTTLVSVGVNGEPATFGLYDGIQLSADGRFVTFMAIFGGFQNPWDLYLRDRDPDQNGVFDEPGSSTTESVRVSTVGPLEVYHALDGTISPDGRYIAYTAQTTENGMFRGERVFLLDRQTSTTIQVDNPLTGGGGGDGTYANRLDLADGHLVYSTTLPYLVYEDTDALPNVFVYDIAAGTNEIIRPNLPNVPDMEYVFSTSISTDGRYVSMTMGDETDPYMWLSYGYAVDRQTQQAHEVGLRPDGTSTGSVYDTSISGDGSAIAYWGTGEGLVNTNGNLGVMVETAVSMSPAETDIPDEGGEFTVEWTAPANTSWTVEQPAWATVSPTSGVGSATLTVTIDANNAGHTRVTTIAIGSESAAFRQVGPIVVDYIEQNGGPTEGGTQVILWGHGFTPQSTVTFGGVPATSVVFLDTERLQATTPPHTYGFVDVTVSDPSSEPYTVFNGFRYFDQTPPVLTPTVTGTSGLDGWYTSDVTVTWTVEDPESEIVYQDCEPLTLTTDQSRVYAQCLAASDGGWEVGTVELRRDATAPTITIQQPEARTYVLNEVAALSYSCDDETSGIEFCVPSQGGSNVNTSSAGTFDFTVTAIDVAGNQATSTVTYTVKATSSVAVQPASGVYGGNATLTASLSSGGAPLAGKTVAFSVDDVSVGSAVTSAGGIASLALALGTRTAGAHTIRADYAGDAQTLASTGTATLTIQKATPTITWEAPAAIMYGTAISSAQLNATADVPGIFNYMLPAGVQNAGTHELSALFQPVDGQNYNDVTVTRPITVNQAPLTIQTNASSKVYGQALPAFSVSGTGFMYDDGVGWLLGTPTFSTSATATSNVGTYAVTPGGVSSPNYSITFVDGTLTITTAATSVSWNTPGAITYGTALSGAQLNATGSVAGTMAYSPAAGAVLDAGTHALSVTFTPNSSNYSGATASVSISVAKATPTITWNAPADITYGTAIGSAQLNATASVMGVFLYTLPGGVVNAGTHELQALFQPLDGQNYNDVAVTRSITVNPAPLTIQTTAVSKVYGEALPAFSLSGTGFMYDDTVGFLFGTPSFATSATATSAPGAYAVTPSGVSSPNYTITFAAGTLTVTKADTTLTLTATPNPSRPNQTVQVRAAVAAAAPGAGTVTGTVEFRENGTLIGMATIVNGVATLSKGFKKGTHPLTATFSGNVNFNGSSGNVTLITD